MRLNDIKVNREIVYSILCNIHVNKVLLTDVNNSHVHITKTDIKMTKSSEIPNKDVREQSFNFERGGYGFL